MSLIRSELYTAPFPSGEPTTSELVAPDPPEEAAHAAIEANALPSGYPYDFEDGMDEEPIYENA